MMTNVVIPVGMINGRAPVATKTSVRKKNVLLRAHAVVENLN